MRSINPQTSFNKFLVICLAGIGDTLLLTPALWILRQGFPLAQIDVLVMHEGAKNLLDCSPDVNRVIHWNFMQQGVKKSLKFCIRLRRNNYDVSLMAYPANRYEYNMVSLLIGAKVRIGHQYNVRCTYGTGRFAFHHHVRESAENMLHNVEENLKLLECLQIHPKRYANHCLRLYFSQEDLTFAEQFLTRHRDMQASLRIGIHPGSGETKNLHLRRWPIGNFAKLADLLILSKSAQVFVFGGNNEKQLRHKLRQNMPQKPIVVENVSLRQSAALIQHCDVFVSVDTSLMHVATAVGTPTVALYGPTNPNLTFPWATSHQVVFKNLPCSPCYFYSKMQLSCPAKRDFECIKSVSVDDVIKSIDILLASR